MSIDNVGRFLGLRAGYAIAQSAVQISRTGDTNENTLASVTIPGGTIGINGQVEIEVLVSVTNNANTKTLRVKFGATTYVTQALPSVASAQYRQRIANRGVANSQVALILPASFGSTTAALTTSAVDTSADVVVAITGQLGTSTDTITLESYRIIVYPKG